MQALHQLSRCSSLRHQFRPSIRAHSSATSSHISQGFSITSSIRTHVDVGLFMSLRVSQLVQNQLHYSILIQHHSSGASSVLDNRNMMPSSLTSLVQIVKKTLVMNKKLLSPHSFSASSAYNLKPSAQPMNTSLNLDALVLNPILVISTALLSTQIFHSRTHSMSADVRPLLFMNRYSTMA